MEGISVSGSGWSVRVRTAERNTAQVRAGKLSFPVGASVPMGEAIDAPSALETFLGALSADLLYGFRDAASKKRIALDSAEVSTSCELENPLVAVGVVGEEGSAQLVSCRVTLFVAADADDSQLDELWQEALRRCPLIATFRQLAWLHLEWRPIA